MPGRRFGTVGGAGAPRGRLGTGSRALTRSADGAPVERVAAVAGGALGQSLELRVRRELRPSVRLATQHVRRRRRPGGARRWWRRRRFAARTTAVGGGAGGDDVGRSVGVALLSAPSRRRHAAGARVAALDGAQQQLQLRVGQLRQHVRLQRILLRSVEFAHLQQALRQMSAFAPEHEHERAAQQRGGSTIGRPLTKAALRGAAGVGRGCVNAASVGADACSSHSPLPSTTRDAHAPLFRRDYVTGTEQLKTEVALLAGRTSGRLGSGPTAAPTPRGEKPPPSSTFPSFPLAISRACWLHGK